MLFGLVTKRELREIEAKLNKRLEEAEWDAKAWYAKFRALYARIARASGAGVEESDRTEATTGETTTGVPADRVAAAKARFWRARR